jgi:hypothetical protein
MHNPETHSSWSGKRLILGIVLPAAIATTILIAGITISSIFQGKSVDSEWGILPVLYLVAYILVGIQSAFCSFFMEWMGKRFFDIKENFKAKRIATYVLIGTALGGVVALSVQYILELDVVGPVRREGVDYLWLISLISGFLTSWILLRNWRSELNLENKKGADIIARPSAIDSRKS